MGKSAARRKTLQRDLELKNQIVIDESRGLIFSTEDELYDHFLPQIQALEKEYFMSRNDDDIHEREFLKYEELLNLVLDDPDEVWEDATTIHGLKVRSYVGHYTSSEPSGSSETVYYVALAYATNESRPSSTCTSLRAISLWSINFDEVN